jgi:hypothetical protein
MGGRPLKTYSFLKFDGPTLTIICGGVIGGGGRCCVREAGQCNYTSHQTKAWEAGSMEPGMYILDGSSSKAFLEHCLPMRDVF